MLLDSNIIIYSVIPQYKKIRAFLTENDSDIAVSAITKLEVLGYHKLNKEEKELFEDFFNNITVLPINSLIITKAIQLKQQQKMSVGDSIIASTAIINKHKIFTNNVEDFQNITELEIIPMSSIL